MHVILVVVCSLCQKFKKSSMNFSGKALSKVTFTTRRGLLLFGGLVGKVPFVFFFNLVMPQMTVSYF